ncbi:Zinc finger protein kiaa0543 [Plakobranchus ocellatus]|uniref:Zinc finger protein kiaa0543 n=1 Tax=Plakobranchus ocellatus TaxID=259542 RepID=A0AAV3ZCM6_9GAST|nr:Zinc finger protein kiaa0543 [Plakobranchus ocellatus]
MEKGCWICSGGENLMQGERNSFFTKVKDVAPNLFVLKCYCHSFNLVASLACEVLSKTAEQLVHDVYNYFKLSPNRQKNFIELQHFTVCEPHKILKPYQTRWLSLSQCVNRILEQCPALELFFIDEVAETKSTQATIVLNNLKTPYVKATLEFINFVLADIVALDTQFQSDDFKLHRLLPEVQKILGMYCQNFMKEVLPVEKMSSLHQDVDDDMKWKDVSDVYPGICAYETLESMKPRERDSFLGRCRDWYRSAIKQILKRDDVSSPVLKAIQDLNHINIINKTASLSSGGILFRNLSIMKQCESDSIQLVDAQWRSLLIGEDIQKGGWDSKPTEEFWREMK